MMKLLHLNLISFLIIIVSATTAAISIKQEYPNTLYNAKITDITTNERHFNVLHRQKRGVGSVISIIAELAPVVYPIIRDKLIKKSCGKKIDAGRANNHYNNNMGNSETLKNQVSARDSTAAQAIHMNSNGYYCDADFCQEMGRVMATLGICSAQYCDCKSGEPQLRECRRGQVFDPMTGTCARTSSAILCH